MQFRRSSAASTGTRTQLQRPGQLQLQLIGSPSASPSPSHVTVKHFNTRTRTQHPSPDRCMLFNSCPTSASPLIHFALRCMETFHHDGNPLAAYLEGNGNYESDSANSESDKRCDSVDDDGRGQKSFAPPPSWQPRVKKWKNGLPAASNKIQESTAAKHQLTRFRNAWSSAVNSWLGRADNERFLEHFRYTIVASQLLEQYLDHGSLNPAAVSGYPDLGLDGTSPESITQKVPSSVYGAAGVTIAALVMAYLLDRFRTQRPNVLSKSRAGLVLVALAVIAFVGYGYNRRQRLRSLRQQAVDGASTLTATWQAFELSSTSALSFIQEVELVSKGFRLNTPLPPASRIEGNATSRRCAKLRSVLYKAFAATIPAYIDACASLRTLITEDDLERYFDVYDISLQDAREASHKDTALSVLDDDPESLKSLRVLSYRAAILRRVTLCSFMALEADGGHPDFSRWRHANTIIANLNTSIASSAERIRLILSEMESISIPITPPKPSTTNGAGFQHTPTREKMRSQVRKISTLSSGIRGLQAKMQILREETSRNIEQTEDLTDLGPSLMAQYESIGADLKELMQAWEAGKQSLQSNITRQERRISMASSSGGLRSPVSSLGGLTAVEEGFPEDALRVLNGDGSAAKGNNNKSNRSSMTPSSSGADANSDVEGGGGSGDQMVFEAIAVPRTRKRGSVVIPREERILKMQEERDRQAAVRARRDNSVSLLRELESVINLKGQQGVGKRTSL